MSYKYKFQGEICKFNASHVTLEDLGKILIELRSLFESLIIHSIYNQRYSIDKALILQNMWNLSIWFLFFVLMTVS